MDLSHLEKIVAPISIISTNVFDIASIGIVGTILTGTAKCCTIIFVILYVYDYFTHEYRYKQWAKTGFKEEDKAKYRIK